MLKYKFNPSTHTYTHTHTPIKEALASENKIHIELLECNRNWISLDQHRPDFWDGEKFIEIKKGCPTQTSQYNFGSEYFPDLFFGTEIDEQINRYPRPLEVRVYNINSMYIEELARRYFPKGEI